MTAVHHNAFELLKAVRGRWLTRAEIAVETGMCAMSVRRCVAEGLAQGVLVERTRAERTRRPGTKPVEVTVASAWVGGSGGA